MAITRERMEAIVKAGETFYELFNELYEYAETTINETELERLRGKAPSAEEWREKFLHIQSILRRHIHPSHGATIAAESQFLRTTRYKAEYNRNKRASQRNQEICQPTNSSAPKRLQSLSQVPPKAVEGPDYKMLSQMHTLAEGYEFAQSSDPIVRRLGQDIIKAHSAKLPEHQDHVQTPSPAEGGGGVAKPHPAELSLSGASCGANQSLSDIGLDLPEPTKDDLDNTSSF